MSTKQQRAQARKAAPNWSLYRKGKRPGFCRCAGCLEPSTTTIMIRVGSKAKTGQSMGTHTARSMSFCDEHAFEKFGEIVETLHGAEQ